MISTAARNLVFTSLWPVLAVDVHIHCRVRVEESTGQPAHSDDRKTWGKFPSKSLELLNLDENSLPKGQHLVWKA